MKTALICDDSKFMRNYIKKILARNNIKVVAEAVNGYMAVEKYKELKPDMVTMDITMPQTDGLHALKEILTGDPNAGVIMITAMGQEGMVKEAIQLGAKGFVVKPFEENTLSDVLKKL